MARRTRIGGTCGQGFGTLSIYVFAMALNGAGQADPQKGPKGGAVATLIPRYSPRENIPWAQTLGQYGTGFQGLVRFPLACSALPGAAPASRRASRRLG